MNIDDCLTTGSSIVASSSTSSLLRPAALQASQNGGLKSKLVDNDQDTEEPSYSDHHHCSPAKRSRITPPDTNVGQPSSTDGHPAAPPSTAFSSSFESSSSSTSCVSTTSSAITITTNSNGLLTSGSGNEIIQSPRQLLTHLMPTTDLSKLPAHFDDFDICRLVYEIMSANNNNNNTNSSSNPNQEVDLDTIELSSSITALNHASALSSLFLNERQKLFNINTIEQCVDLIDQAKNVIVLTGAGCSVSCGIPDFRSRDGVYARLRVDFPDLPDPQAMFDIYYFQHDPRPFFKFAKEIYPGQFRPSVSHMFVKKLEQQGKLLRNYTQNIDTLEQVAEISNVIQCHGSFNTATCTSCKFQVGCEYIKERIFRQQIPYCDRCTTRSESSASKTTEGRRDEPKASDDEGEEELTPSTGILKPDIVFFGEGLPEIYHTSINEDKNKCDLLIVIGSSLKVKPVANIPRMLRKDVPQILINRESLKNLNFDVELLGDCDVIVQELLLRLEQKRLSRKKEAAAIASEPERAVVAANEDLEWSDICKIKTPLTKIEDQEAEQIVFNNRQSINEVVARPVIHERDEESDLDEEEDEDDNESESEQTETTNVESKQESSAENGEIEQKETELAGETELLSEQQQSAMNNKEYTRDYLKENSFIYLKPNIYVFHGAELSLKNAKRKLKRLRRRYNVYMKSVNGELIEEHESEEDSNSQTNNIRVNAAELVASTSANAGCSAEASGEHNEDDEESDESFTDDDEFSTDEEDETDEFYEEEDDDDDDDDDDDENDDQVYGETKKEERPDNN